MESNQLVTLILRHKTEEAAEAEQKIFSGTPHFSRTCKRSDILEHIKVLQAAVDVSDGDDWINIVNSAEPIFGNMGEYVDAGGAGDAVILNSDGTITVLKAGKC